MKHRSRIGLGTTNLWNGPDEKKEEVFLAAIRDYGVTVIDTAEMYGNAEQGVARIYLADEFWGLAVRENDELRWKAQIAPETAEEKL